MNLTIIREKITGSKASDAVSRPTDALLDILLELERFGKPRVGFYIAGWACTVECNITPLGAKFEVSSDYGLKNPLIAAQQCLERTRAAVLSIGGRA